MKDYRIANTDDEVMAILEIFDSDRSGTIAYEEFLRTIVGEMNDFRRGLATKAFQKMDVNGDGVLDINDVRINYSAKKHPDVMMGKQTEDEVLYEFLDTFEAHYAIKNPGSRDGVIQLKEWLEYYNNISCNIDLDEYFELMIKNCYKL